MLSTGLSTGRGAVARLMPHGASPRIAEEVRRTLEAPSARSAGGDIERIVDHAMSEVPFYQRLAGTAFEDLPVVSKPMMVAEPQDFFAVGVRPERLTSRVSSGTSGIKFQTFIDADRVARHRAELVGAYRYLGTDPFGTFLHCRAWLRVPRHVRASYALRGQRLYAAEQDEATIQGVARWLRRRPGTALIGICSYIELLLDRFDALGIEFPPGTVSLALGAGEPPTAHLSRMVRRQFGIDLRMRYSNTENGVMGFTAAAGTSYKLDTSTFHLEILRHEADTPAPAGELGRIVVTDLYNRAMPFLRYDTGDLGRFAVDGSGRTIPNVLAELGGRIRDFPIAGTRAEPRRASHFTIIEPVELIPSIRQFQLRQHDVGHFTWILNAERSRELEAQLRRILDDTVGDILSSEVVYSDDTLHSGAEKRQTFVNDIPDSEELLRIASAGAREDV